MGAGGLSDTCYTWSPKTAVFYILFNIFLTRASFKILRGVFLERVHRCKKCAYIQKVTSYGRAETENVNYTSGHIFNFSSATRVRFQLWLHFSHLWTSCEKSPSDFFIHCVSTNLSEIWHYVLQVSLKTLSNRIEKTMLAMDYEFQ